MLFVMQGLTSPVYLLVCRPYGTIPADNCQLSADNCLWDWVVATAAPRVAREDTLKGKPAAFKEAVFLNGFDAIVGAGRDITATLSEPW
jgi:hypothetical protein